MMMPKWHEMMLPVLRALDESEMRTSFELRQEMVKVFSLSEEEQSERLESGQLRYYNRMYWAITDLQKVAYLRYGEEKGTYLITPEGREFLKRHAEPVTAKDLMNELDTFREWKQGYLEKEKKAKGSPDSPAEESESPQELRQMFAPDLLQAIMEQSPWFFEYLVGRLLQAMATESRSTTPCT